MADSNITTYETSTDSGQPLECYRFVYGSSVFSYTSNRFDVSLAVTNSGLTSTEVYTATYIKRDTIKPSSQGDDSTVTVTVDKDNAVAALFKGSPPSRKEKLSVVRLHDQDNTA